MIYKQQGLWGETDLEFAEKEKHEQFEEKLAAKLAEAFDCPCYYSPFDEEIGEWLCEWCCNKWCCNKYCDCAKVPSKECWLRVFEKLKRENEK